tara:strand:+ start:1132 stop:1572 length:441 start_codon:yes stop_codon:yes gene_type:complete
MIKCELREMAQYGKYLPDYKKTKHGRYISCNFSFKTFNIKHWVVGAYIDVDHSRYLEEGLTEEEIVKQCIEYLNQAPPRKKYQKKKPQPSYGVLNELPLRYSFKTDEEGTYIEALLITDQRKSKKFWGQGGIGRMPKKRGRPRKDA